MMHTYDMSPWARQGYGTHWAPAWAVGRPTPAGWSWGEPGSSLDSYDWLGGQDDKVLQRRSKNGGRRSSAPDDRANQPIGLPPGLPAPSQRLTLELTPTIAVLSTEHCGSDDSGSFEEGFSKLPPPAAKTTPLESPPGLFTEVPITSLMIRNLPNRHTAAQLITELHDMGFEGAYNFLYLPTDWRRGCNVGYAFINFKEPEAAARFTKLFAGHTFKQTNSRKVGAVAQARIQGFEANIEHFIAALQTASDKKEWPIVFRDDVQVPWQQVVEEHSAASKEE